MSVLTFFGAILLLACGVLLTFKSGFFQFRIRRIFSATFGKLMKTKDFEGFKAMSIALGSTIGIGNIVGVAAAICIGGPGAVFWMLLTGIFGMMTKFAEIYICSKEAKVSGRSSGGPMYVFESKFKTHGKRKGITFAVFVIAASLFAGNLSQSKAIYEFANLGFKLDALPLSLVIIPLVFIIASGKDKLYKDFSAWFVPLMSVVFVAALLVMIVTNRQNLLPAIVLIFKSAFGFKQAAGGFGGAILAITVKTGVMKGLFTNEAGMGSAPIAHCSAKDLNPYVQGCWGIVEVFVDTVLVCMLTALAVLSSPAFSVTTEPFTLICQCFYDAFGSFGIKTLSFSAICFAFASIIGWSFYGVKALEYITDSKNARMIYILSYVLVIPLSSVVSGNTMWVLTDVFNSFMLIPNAVLLLLEANVMEFLRKDVQQNELFALSKKMRSRKNRI